MSANISTRVFLPPLHAGQQAVMEGEKRYNVLACGRRWGKTKFAKDRLLTHPKHGALYGNPVAWYAGTVQTFADVWREVYDDTKAIQAYANKQDKVIRLQGGGQIDFWTLHNGTESMAGRGRQYSMVGVDEAAYVKGLMELWDKAIRPTLTDRRGIAYIYSTPKGVLNDFYDFFKRGLSNEDRDKSWASWQLPSHDNPFLPRNELEELELEYTGRELAYRQEMLAEFVADAGLIFQGEWFRRKPAPKLTTVYQSWDTAMTEKALGLDRKGKSSDPDSSVGICGAKDELGRLWLLDMMRGCWSTPTVVENMLRFQSKWNKGGRHCPEVFIEGGPAGKSCAQVLESRCREMRQAFNITMVPPRRDKVTRATPLAMTAQLGNLLIADDFPGFDEFKQELVAFPGARHDDQVDAAALLASRLPDLRVSKGAFLDGGRIPGKLYADQDPEFLRAQRFSKTPARAGWGEGSRQW